MVLLQSRWSLSRIYLIDLHSLLWGPGQRVGSSEDPELSLDQRAVGQVHSADVEVDDSVVRVRGSRLNRIWTKKNTRRMTNDPTTSHADFDDVVFIPLVKTALWCIVSDIITADECLGAKLQVWAQWVNVSGLMFNICMKHHLPARQMRNYRHVVTSAINLKLS